MYIPRFLTKLIPSITVTVLLLNLLAPVGLVFAQDGSPPADPPPAENVAADEQPVEEPVAEESTGEETADEEPAADEPGAADAAPEEAQRTEEPAENENQEDSGNDLAGAAGTEEEQPDAEELGDETEVSEEPAEEATEETETEENPIAEAVEALDEADAVLLDEAGEPLSMATQEAAEALAAPDPQFCPAGSSYGDPACGTNHANMADAIVDALAAAGSGTSGTIFVDAGSFTGFTLSGFTFGTSLTIQGNANNGGTTNYTSAVVVDNSNIDFNLTFNDVTFDLGVSVDGMVGDLNFNDVIANNAGGDGIFVDNHDGAVSLENVTANGAGDDGAEIDNRVSSSDEGVTVTNSDFNGNIDDGLQIWTDGATNITNVNANSNGVNGIEIDSSGAVTLNNVTANMNGDDGVDIENYSSGSTENVSITGLTAEQNAYDGLFVETGGDATLTSINANNNDNDGIGVEAVGTITLNNVNANNNDDDGAELYNWYAADPAVNVFNSNFNGNGATAVDGLGLEVLSFGTVTIDGVSASNNAGSTDTNLGLYIDNTGFGNDAPVNITNSVFNSNIGVDDGTGLEIYSDGQITLNGVQANNNQATDAAGEAYGLYVENYGAGSGVTINNSSFNSNVGGDYAVGLEAYTDGQITLNNVQANLTGALVNTSLGAFLVNTSSSTSQGVLVENSTFNGNFSENFVAGLLVRSGGSITLHNVAANGNTSTSLFAGGALLTNGLGAGGSDVDAPVNVFNSSFNNNVGPTDGIGLSVYSQGNITLSHVSANGNSVDGVYLQIDSTGPQNTSIYCSFMQNNGDTGIAVDGGGGDLKIQSTDTSGNGVSPLDIINVVNTVFGQTNCDPSSGVDDRDDGKHAPLDPKDSITIVLDLYPHSVTFPPMNLLECSGYVKSLFYASDLPAELYAGDDFLRAMKIRIEGCDIPDGGMFTIGFDIPAAEQANEFAILFWDGASWVEVPGQMTADGRYTGTWPTTGTFVLVTR